MSEPKIDPKHELTEALDEAFDWGRLEETHSRRSGLSWQECREVMVEHLLTRLGLRKSDRTL